MIPHPARAGPIAVKAGCLPCFRIQGKRPLPKHAGQAALSAAWPGKLSDIRYFLGVAGAFVAGGELMSPLSLQATKNVALINARNRYVNSFFMPQF